MCNMLRAFGHLVTTCCGMLRVETRASAHVQAQHLWTNLAKRLQHHATSTNVTWKIWPFSNLSQQHPPRRKTSQHVATWWPNARNNMLGPTMLRYAALKCCDRLAGPSSVDGRKLKVVAYGGKILPHKHKLAADAYPCFKCFIRVKIQFHKKIRYFQLRNFRLLYNPGFENVITPCYPMSLMGG